MTGFDTIMITGGRIEDDFALSFMKKYPEAFVAAADRGLEFCLRAGRIPDLIVGDFDSLSEEGKQFLEGFPQDRLVRLIPEKDDTDTQSALGKIRERGGKKVLILGCTGTRLDHVFANLHMLVWGKDRGMDITLADPNNLIFLTEKKEVFKKEESFGRYVSFFPLGGGVKGLSLKGFKYTLKDYDLTVSDGSLSVSNEILEETAEVSYKEGNLMVIFSRD